MLNQKKIKVVKRRNPVFSFTAPERPAGDKSGFHTRKTERELAARVNGWVSDWRNQKRVDEINAAAFLSKSEAACR